MIDVLNGNEEMSKKMREMAEWCCNIQNSMLLYNIYDTPLSQKQRLYQEFIYLNAIFYSLRKCKSKFNKATTFEQSLSPVLISGN